jgi:hypothetical protein
MKNTIKSDDDEGIDDFNAKKVSPFEYASYKALKSQIQANKPIIDKSTSLRKYSKQHPNL